MSSSKEDFKKDSYGKKAYLATVRQTDNFPSNYINATTKTHLPQVGKFTSACVTGVNLSGRNLQQKL